MKLKNRSGLLNNDQYFSQIFVEKNTQIFTVKILSVLNELTPGPLPETKPQRPTLLTVLCILTFVGSGMNLFSSLVIAGFYDVFIEIAQAFSAKFNIPGIDLLLEMKPVYFLVTGLLYIGSLAGAILMLLMKKTGFHVYTVSQILLILAPMYFMHLPGPGLPEMLFSGLFIFLYSMNLKYMSESWKTRST